MTSIRKENNDLIMWPIDYVLIEWYAYMTQSKEKISFLLGHYILTCFSRCLEEENEHLVFHVQCPSFDVTLY